jgi:hypothetical protein
MIYNISGHTLIYDNSHLILSLTCILQVALFNPPVSAREAVMHISGTRGNPRTSAQSGEVGVPRHLLTW